MSLFSILSKVLISLAVAAFSVFIMTIDPGFEGDSASISLWIFVITMIILSLSLSPDKKSILEKIQSIYKHKDLKHQLVELEKLITQRERRKEFETDKRENLLLKRKRTFERIEKLRKAVTPEVQEKNKKQIEDYTERIENIKITLEEMDESIAELESELKMLYNEKKSIESNIKINQQKKKTIDKKVNQVFKV